jgi:serine/threonine-protein kinase HipA
MCGDIYAGVTRNLPQKVADKNRGDYLAAPHWDHFAKDIGITGTQTA